MKIIVFFSALFVSFISYTQTSGNITNATLNTCSYLLYDDGGPSGNYTETDYTMTICATSGTDLYFLVDFLALGVAFNGDADILKIYDGTGTGGAVLFDSDVNVAPYAITSSSGCITINLQTDPSMFSTDPGAGFEIIVSCTVPETCSDGILNHGEVQIDCGGPNCSPCYQVTACSPNVVTNGYFETSTPVCGVAQGTGFGTNNQIPRPWIGQTPVDGWFGTAIRIDDNISYPSPDYYNASCTNSGAVSCMTGAGSLGFFVHFFGQSAEYIQTALNAPLEAGEEYCVSVRASTRRGASSNNPDTDKLGFYFHNNPYSSGTGFAEWNADNAGSAFFGAGTTLNIIPQVVNPPGQMIGAACKDFIYSFCAAGGESHLIAGNFTPGPPASGSSEYVSIDNLVVKKSCPLTFDSQITASAVPDCAGSCVDLYLATSNQAGGCEVTNDFTYQWYQNGTVITGQTNDTLFNICPSSTVVYSCEITYNAGCRSYTKPEDETSIVFNCGGFTATATAAPDELCSGSCTDLTATPSPAGSYTYEWRVQGTTTIISTTPTFNVCPTSTKTYQVTVSDGTDDIIEAVTVTVYANPVLDPINDVSLCNPYTLPQISGTGMSGNQAYYTGPNGTGTMYNPGDVISSDITLYAFDEDGICSDEQSFDVSFTGGGISISLVTSEPLCYSQNNGSVSIAVGIGGVDPGAVFTIMDADSNVLNQSNSNAAEFLTTGWYYCYVDNPGSCDGMDSVFLDQPDSLFFAINSSIPLCNGSADGAAWVTNVVNNQGPYSVAWNSSVTGSDTISTLSAGSHTAVLIDSVGCTAQISFTLVNPPAIVIGQLTGNPSQCRGKSIYPGSGTVSVAASGGTGTLTYLWSGNGNISNTNTWGNRKPGWYVITVTDSKGCWKKDSIYVDSLNPIANFTVNPNFGYTPLSVNITDLSDNRVTNSWNFNDSIQNSIVIGYHMQQAPFDSVFIKQGAHKICLIVSNDYECFDTLCKLIQVYPEVELELPNVITPNGDGMNDVWSPFENKGLQDVVCIFLNRWGNEVFRIEDLTTPFLGEDSKGKPLSDGVYSVVYEATGLDGVPYKGTGFVHVIKE